MMRHLFASTFIAWLCLIPNDAATSGQKLKSIRLEIANPSDLARAAENIVIKVENLKRIAPDFKPLGVIVSADVLGRSVELPSQVDDMDGDGKLDELAFQIDLQTRQTRHVTIAYGEIAEVLPLRRSYPARTHAKFTAKYEGMGWESEVTAWRLYFDRRNAIDLFGKRSPCLALELFGAPEYDYHKESPVGRDIYKNGDALGIGSVGALVDGKVVKVGDVAERKWRIISTGPVRAVVELRYNGWKVAAKSVDLVSRITQWAGEGGFEHSVIARNADGLTLVAGLPRKDVELIERQFGKEPEMQALATWGPQVLAPGASAASSLPDQNLGLAIITVAALPKVIDADNLLLPLKLASGAANWYVTAAWDQELSEKRRIPACQTAEGSSTPIKSQQAFLAYLQALAERRSQPARVTLPASESKR
ncbi:MAG TPA: DUF4861 family protein [Blastocatellia bacterium]